MVKLDIWIELFKCITFGMLLIISLRGIESFSTVKMFSDLDKILRRKLYFFIIVYLSQIWLLTQITECIGTDDCHFSNIQMTISLSIMMVIEAIAITNIILSNINDKEIVGRFIFFGVWQIALAMIVANEVSVHIYGRLLANIIYLTIPAYIGYKLTTSPMENK